MLASELLNVMQREHEEWTRRNFPDQINHPHQPLLGVVEECGELEDALNSGDMREIEDALGDIVIFLSAVCSATNLALGDVYDGRRTLPPLRSPLYHASRLCHYTLKREQSIRGSDTQHFIDQGICIQQLIGELDRISRMQLGASLFDPVLRVWAKVKERDWTADRVQGSPKGFCEGKAIRPKKRKAQVRRA